MVDVSLIQQTRALAGELSRLAAAVAAEADAAVYQATRDHSAAEVAEALGVSVPTVRKAVRQHGERQLPFELAAEKMRAKRRRSAPKPA